MPRNAEFWNPYRWVPVGKDRVAHAAPEYHHRWSGLAGRIDCRLTALTPFLINDGSHRFVRTRHTQKPYIPATSLKGLIRSLAELLGNAAQPFGQAQIDPDHTLERASTEVQGEVCLDVAARLFGHLHGGQVFAGLVRFSDGAWAEGRPVPQAQAFKIAGGTPDPGHAPFYPDRKRRKFYHHHVGTNSLVPPHAGIRQFRTVYPLPPGVEFTLRAEFENLREEELALLLYCLFLEEQVTVILGEEALRPLGTEPVTLTGPLRHKFGYGKPQGGGSVRIEPVRLTLRPDPAERYRGRGTVPVALEGDALRAEVTRRTAALAARTDDTMRHLRAMLIYAEGDPRAGHINYPDYNWFLRERQTRASTPLKPTL
jgi:hypothetical protein